MLSKVKFKRGTNNYQIHGPVAQLDRAFAS